MRGCCDRRQIHGLRPARIDGLHISRPRSNSVGELLTGDLLSLDLTLLVLQQSSFPVLPCSVYRCLPDEVSAQCEFAVCQLLLVQRQNQLTDFRFCLLTESALLLDAGGIQWRGIGRNYFDGAFALNATIANRRPSRDEGSVNRGWEYVQRGVLKRRSVVQFSRELNLVAQGKQLGRRHFCLALLRRVVELRRQSIALCLRCNPMITSTAICVATSAWQTVCPRYPDSAVGRMIGEPRTYAAAAGQKRRDNPAHQTSDSHTTVSP
ncbi:hypothetical protein AWB66_05888 [Caballeronia telluris]|uniref:Uncharacterized protein n=1 Tax=Caballeronia telluris TaxID=326475 RepID=A0A158KDN8_9BURK|nr:hypothetical protein AWB66_05888 [Caballeronia telluris]